MKECEKRYNEIIKNPANFSLDRRTYFASCRAALEWLDNLLEKGDDSWTEGVLSGIQKSIKKELEDE